MAFSTQQLFSPFQFLTKNAATADRPTSNADQIALPKNGPVQVTTTVEELAEKYKISEELLSEKCAEIRKLTTDYAQLQSEYNDSFYDSTDIDDHANHEKIRLENSKLKTENARFLARINELIAFSEAKIVEVEQLTLAYDKIKRELSYLIETYNDGRARALAEQERLSREACELREQIAESTRSEQILQQQYDQLMSENKLLIQSERQLEAAENAIQSYEGDIATFVKQIDTLQVEIAKKNELLLDAHTQIGVAEALEMKMTSVEGKSVSQMSVNSMHSAREDIMQEIRKATHFTMILLQEGYRANGNLKKDIDELKQSIRSKVIPSDESIKVTTRCEHSTNMSDGACVALADATTSSTEIERARRQYDDEQIAVKEKLMQEQIYSLTAELTEATKTTECLQAKLNSTVVEVDALKRELSQNDAVHKTATMRLKCVFRTKLDGMTANVKVLQSQNEKLLRKLKHGKRMTSHVAGLDQKFRSELELLTSASEAMVRENEELKIQLVEHELKYSDLLEEKAAALQESDEQHKQAISDEMSKRKQQVELIDQLTAKLTDFETIGQVGMAKGENQTIAIV